MRLFKEHNSQVGDSIQAALGNIAYKGARRNLFGTEDTFHSVKIPTLDPRQSRIMNSMHRMVNPRIGQNEYSTFAPFFDTYGDVEGVARARINNAYGPQNWDSLYANSTQGSLNNNITPRLNEIYQGAGTDPYLQDANATLGQDVESMKAYSEFQGSEARKAALYQQMQQTPEQIQAMAQLQAKLSDPTQARAFQLAMDMLGIKTFDTYNYTEAGQTGVLNKVLGL